MILEYIFSRICFYILTISAHLICDFFNLNEKYLSILRVYGLMILFNLEGVPTAVFRLEDKFSIFAYRSAIVAIIKLILFTCFFYLSANLKWYLIGALLAQISRSIYFISKSSTIVKKFGLGGNNEIINL